MYALEKGEQDQFLKIKNGSDYMSHISSLLDFDNNEKLETTDTDKDFEQSILDQIKNN